MAYEQLEEQHGPLRPVGGVPDEDRQALEQALLRAGRKAVATLAAALHRVAMKALGSGYSTEVREPEVDSRGR
ncbi:hypothetical protein [Nonomuraea sp. NPDC003804]|uniref:hypothetical protein n=1 Tax=Nonomuraea sp. NPDC003804 TaxID=3154547 RepID=UPI0033B37634